MDQSHQTGRKLQPLGVLSFLSQGEVLLIWAIFSLIAFLMLLGSIMGAGGWLLMGLTLVLSLPFFQYGFMIIEYTARGHQVIPRLSYEAFMSDKRPLKELVYLLAVLSLIRLAPEPLQTYVALILLFITPAVTAVIAMDNSLIAAVNPVRIWHFIRNMGFVYQALRLTGSLILFSVLLLIEYKTTLFSSLPGRIFLSVASVGLLLVMFRSTGALLYVRHNQLGIRTDFSPEQEEMIREQEEERQRQEFLGELYKLMKVDKLSDAGKKLEQRLKKDRYATDRYFFGELNRWEDHRLAWKHAQGYIARLSKDNVAEAWRTLERVWHDSDGKFLLDSAAVVIRLAESARTDERKRISVEMLSYLDEDFPNYPHSRQGHLAAAELCCDLGDFERARTFFHKVVEKRGKIDKARFERCLEILSKDV